MLIALLAAFLLGGGGLAGGIVTTETVKQVGKQVEAAVTDSARAEAAAATLGDLKAELKGFEKSFAKSGKALTGLYKDHGAGSAAIVSVLDELNSDWEAAQQRALDLRFELRKSLTEEEWATVFGDG
jgi:hypothetical protein